MTHAEAVDLLGKIKFFAGLPPAYLRRIADIGAEEEHLGAATIFEEGTKGDKFYLIVHGVLRINERFLVEVVEALGLCPWAEGARKTGALRREVIVDEAEALDKLL